MKKLSILLALLPALLFVGSVSAAGNCTPVYGGGVACNTSTRLMIDKTVQNPQTNTFVDSLGANDVHFQPGQTVTFRIVVTNPSIGTEKNITVKDLLPASMELVNGTGTYDTSSHTLTFVVDSLNGKSAKTYTIQGRIGTNDSLSGNTPVVCLTNGATAEISSFFGGKTLVQDNSQFCVEKSGTSGGATTPGTTQVTPTAGMSGQMQPTGIPNQTKGGQVVYAPQGNTKSPATGPEALGYLALAPLGALGWALRRVRS